MNFTISALQFAYGDYAIELRMLLGTPPHYHNIKGLMLDMMVQDGAVRTYRRQGLADEDGYVWQK